MLLTTREVAEKLGVSDRRVRALIYEGRIRAVKVGRYNLVDEKDAHFKRKRIYRAKDKETRSARTHHKTRQE